MTEKIRVAVVGLGFGAEFLPIYQRHPDTELYAICQRNEEKLREVGEQFGVERRFSSYEALLADPNVDAVHINTPIAAHAPMSKAGARSGWAWSWPLSGAAWIGAGAAATGALTGCAGSGVAGLAGAGLEVAVSLIGCQVEDSTRAPAHRNEISKAMGQRRPANADVSSRRAVVPSWGPCDGAGGNQAT